ncbi:MAG: hypothetical protein AB2651_22045 [Candidatus Thiodiazotropha sp.]
MESQEEIDEYASKIHSQTISALVESMVTATASTSPSIDKTSSWLLAGIGATIALIIPNLDRLTIMLGNKNLSLVILLLLLASLFGILQKYLALLINVQLKAMGKTEELAADVIQRHLDKEKDISSLANKHNISIDPTIDFNKVFGLYKLTVPWYMRFNFEKKMRHHFDDPFLIYKKIGRYYGRQTVYALIQLFITVFVICIIGISV